MGTGTQGSFLQLSNLKFRLKGVFLVTWKVMSSEKSSSEA